MAELSWINDLRKIIKYINNIFRLFRKLFRKKKLEEISSEISDE
jgi:hypothetical protein